MINTVAVHHQMRQVLVEAISILYPVQVNPDDYIIPYAWRDIDYVGFANNQVVVWRGWSANLKTLNSSYRTIYVALVANILSEDERLRLFGTEFSEAIKDADNFVILFVVGCPFSSKDKIQAQGFRIRQVNQKIVHPCYVEDAECFLKTDPLLWAAQAAKLLNLYAQLCSAK